MDEDKSTMIMIIAMLIGAMIILTGCQEYPTEQTSVSPRIRINNAEVVVYPMCEDNVVCYETGAFSNGRAGSCFRDQDLVDKYCKVK